MGEIVKFPLEKIRQSEVEYDLETVQIVSETLEDIMEDRGYELNKKLYQDIKVLTNLAYAMARRQASQKDLHPFHETMNEMNAVIDSAMKMYREEQALLPETDDPTNDN